MSALDFFESVDDNYGIDPNGPVTLNDTEDDVYTIPQTTLKFSEADYSFLRQSINPNGPTYNYGIDLYDANP